MTVATRAPLYARVLRLRHLRPAGLACFALFEGTIGLAVLLALAEVTSWWAVVVLPLAVAMMVKLNDVLSGLIRPAGATAPARQVTANQGARHRLLEAAPAAAVGSVGVPAFVPLRPTARAVRQGSRDVADPVDPVDSPQQRFRQSAQRRYR